MEIVMNTNVNTKKYKGVIKKCRTYDAVAVQSGLAVMMPVISQAFEMSKDATIASYLFAGFLLVSSFVFGYLRSVTTGKPGEGKED